MNRPGKETFCFDIDGVIAKKVSALRYDLAKPNRRNIDLVNSLYRRGHRIIIFTARGSLTGIDWTKITRRQLSRWKVKYHQLLFGKPAADYYIDDRSISIRKLRKIVSGTDGTFIDKQ